MPRAGILRSLALWLLLPACSPALERAPEPVAPPADVMVMTGSPRRLAATLDAIVDAATRNIPEKAAPPFGALGGLIAGFNMPSLFDNPDVAVAALADLGDGKDVAFAVALDGVEPKRLAADLKAAGFGLTTRGKTLVVDLAPFSPGEQLYLLPLGGSRIVAALSEGMNGRLASAAAEWRPDWMARDDVAIHLDLRRAREAYPDFMRSFREKLDIDVAAPVFGRMATDFGEEFCRNVAGALQALADRLLVLPRQIDVVGLTLGLHGDLVELALAVVPEKGGSLSRLAAGYADRPAPAYSLTRTVGVDAVLLTASNRLGGTLFEEGEFLAGAAGTLAAAAVPAEAGAIAALQREFAGNPVAEEVSGYYLSRLRLLRGDIARVADGKAYADLLARSATTANRVLGGVFDSSLKPPKRRLGIGEETGSSGSAKYRRFFPVSDPPDKGGGMDSPLSYSLYLAANRNLVLTLLGNDNDLSPEAVPEFIGLLGKSNRPALVDIPEVRPIFEKARDARLGFSLFRPGTLLTVFFWLALQSDDMREAFAGRSSPEAALSRIPEGNAVAGCALDAAPGVLKARLLVPLKAIDEVAVIISAVENARNAGKVEKRENGDWEDGDWEDGDTGGW